MAAAASTEVGKKSGPFVAKTVVEDRVIEQSRLFDAPVELVFQAFTDPRHVDQWWGPNGFRNETHSMDFKVGGYWRFTMHGPDGKNWPNWIRFDQIRKNELLDYDHGGEGDEPHFHVTIRFEKEGAKTRVTMRSIFPSAEVVQQVVKNVGALEGGYQTLARLSGFLPSLEAGQSEKKMVLTRVFDAPAAVVFKAWTTPEAVKRWWGPIGMTSPTVEMDFRVGGKYRIVMKDGRDGAEYPFHGKYLEIVPNKKIVFDAEIEHTPEFVVSTITFVEEDGKTLVTVEQDVPKNAMMAKGQREGWNGQLIKLADVLKS